MVSFDVQPYNRRPDEKHVSCHVAAPFGKLFLNFPPFLENFNHFLVFIAQTDTVVKPKNKLWNSCVKIMLSDKHFKG